MSLGLHYKNQKKIFREIETDTPYLEYPLFQNTGIVRHGFSTRKGGVSQGFYSSLNLSFTRGDRKADVLQNFQRIGKAMGIDPHDMILARQSHSNNVRKAAEQERGMGIFKPAGFQDADGLVTDVPGLCLVTFFADCVPLYFVDPIKKAIGLCHSGWRGTVSKIGNEVVKLMQKEYGSDPLDILSAIGPSICRDCYEVSEDVILQFREHFTEKWWKDLFYKKENGKYQLDLWKANEIVLLESGIQREHIAVTNLCTHCNSRLLYSHRAAGEKRGSLCAFLALK